MASLSHCAFCFEVLSASLEKRQPLGLGDVSQLWAAYIEEGEGVGNNDDDGDNDIPPRPAAISRLVSDSQAPSSSSSSSSLSSSPLSTPGPDSKSSSRTSLATFARPLIPERLRPSPRSATAETTPQHAPLFVTWNTIDRAGGRKSLRGCIGTFAEQPLERGLRDYALTSAFDDVRFQPVALRELPGLEVAVTLLTDFESAADPMDWELGKHGLRLSFTYHGRRYGSCYLPDVAREQGWTREETIVSLMRKAGWSGRKDDWKKVNMDVIRFQGKAIGLRYDDWKQWRDWASAQGYEKEHLD